MGLWTGIASAQSAGRGAGRGRGVLAERTQSLWKSVSATMPTGPLDQAWRGRPSPEGQAWFLNSSWPQRAEKLYRLAAEVEKKVGR